MFRASAKVSATAWLLLPVTIRTGAACIVQRARVGRGLGVSQAFDFHHPSAATRGTTVDFQGNTEGIDQRPG
jgi:hypothetical protein